MIFTEKIATNFKEEASEIVDKYKESPFVTEEVLKKWIENEFKRIDAGAENRGYKEIEKVFIGFCVRNKINLKTGEGNEQLEREK